MTDVTEEAMAALVILNTMAEGYVGTIELNDKANKAWQKRDNAMLTISAALTRAREAQTASEENRVSAQHWSQIAHDRLISANQQLERARSAEAEAMQWEAHYNAAVAKISTLTEEKEAWKSARGETEVALVEVVRQRDGLLDQVAALTEERDAAVRGRAHYKERAQKFSREADELDAQAATLAKVRDAAIVERAVADIAITAAQAEIAALRADVDALTTQLEQARKAIKPFGDEAMLWADHGADTKVYTITGKGMSVEDVEMCIVADLRRAASIAKGEG